MLIFVIYDMQNKEKIIHTVLANTPSEGLNSTKIASLKIFKSSTVTGNLPAVYEPSLFVVVQGAKIVTLGNMEYSYDTSSYLVSSVQLPVSGRITNASSDKPFLSIQILFSPQQILDVARYAKTSKNLKNEAFAALGVERLDEELADAVYRMVSLLDTPEHMDALYPLIEKEVLYRVLCSSMADTLLQFAVNGSNAQNIMECVQDINDNLSDAISVEKLAKNANMSISSFHRHFKQITSMSPIQYQKLLRLQEAKRLLLSGSVSEASEAAFAVGYESPSQFSREYVRLFGLPPMSDVKNAKNLQ